MCLKLFFLSFIVLLLSSNITFASIGPVSPKCPFIGEVKDITSRKEAGGGISEGKFFTYIDLTLSITHIYDKEPQDSLIDCNIVEGERQIFQMHNSFLGKYNPSIPKIGTCIKGYSQFKGDGNFMSGRWLTVEEKLPITSCASKHDIIIIKK